MFSSHGSVSCGQKKNEQANSLSMATDGMYYMLAHHIVVQHKLNEHCAQRFVTNTHFSKLLFCVLISPLVS